MCQKWHTLYQEWLNSRNSNHVIQEKSKSNIIYVTYSEIPIMWNSENTSNMSEGQWTISSETIFVLSNISQPLTNKPNFSVLNYVDFTIVTR